MDNRRSLQEAIEQNQEEITRIIKEREKSLESAPEGRLRISRRKKGVQFYQIKEKNMRHGKYLKKEDANIAVALAQKSYDEQAVVLLKKILKEMKGVETKNLFVQVDQLYSKLSIERRKLVTPVRLSDSRYVELWESEEYKGLSFREEDNSDFYTDKGERVRSKSEILIANQLFKHGVPYRYEYPLKLYGGKIVYPDFMVLNVRTRKEYYWEHIGLLDYPDYRENVMHKLEDYAESGYFPGERLIITAETTRHPLKMRMIEMLIKKYCK